MAFYGRALLPTPQENALVVEQAGKPVLENGAAYEFDPILLVPVGDRLPLCYIC